MNRVQCAAYELIQADARFMYTIVDVLQNAKNIKSNYIMMCQPYIGIFTYGSELWCQKMGLEAPSFNEEEKKYYEALRQGHKLFERSYEEYKKILVKKYIESEDYFYSIRRIRERILGYYNIGVDICGKEFCGNTILCSMYMPIRTLGNGDIGPWLMNISIIAGELCGYFKCIEFPVYKYDVNLDVRPKDYHFYKKCPLKIKNEYGLLLFSVLCSVNYVTCFIEKFFCEEIPQKFKMAYLQYYYLCDFIKDLNKQNGTDFYLNDTMKDREFRNCLAHYGLGQYMQEKDIIPDDILKGLTYKAFNMDYLSAKTRLYGYLYELVEQVKKEILF